MPGSKSNYASIRFFFILVFFLKLDGANFNCVN